MCNGTSTVLVLSALQLLKVANGEEHSSSMKMSTADLKAFNISGFVDGFTTRMCSGTFSPQTLEILKGMTAASMGHADEAIDSPNYQHCFNIASMLSEQLMEVGIGNRPLGDGMLSSEPLVAWSNFLVSMGSPVSDELLDELPKEALRVSLVMNKVSLPKKMSKRDLVHQVRSLNHVLLLLRAPMPLTPRFAPPGQKATAQGCQERAWKGSRN
jgi:hypothetical protein